MESHQTASAPPGTPSAPLSKCQCAALQTSRALAQRPAAQVPVRTQEGEALLEGGRRGADGVVRERIFVQLGARGHGLRRIAAPSEALQGVLLSTRALCSAGKLGTCYSQAGRVSGTQALGWHALGWHAVDCTIPGLRNPAMRVMPATGSTSVSQAGSAHVQDVRDAERLHHLRARGIVVGAEEQEARQHLSNQLGRAERSPGALLSCNKHAVKPLQSGNVLRAAAHLGWVHALLRSRSLLPAQRVPAHGAGLAALILRRASALKLIACSLLEHHLHSAAARQEGQ